MTGPDTEPHYGEEADDQPTYGEGDKTASGAGTDEDRNPDLHGSAREVGDAGNGDQVAETPGGG